MLHPQESGTPHRYLLTISWLLLLVVVLLPGAAAMWAANHLLRLPDLPLCEGHIQTSTSATDRLYCAEILADGRSPVALQQAIQLVDSVPDDDPLRPESDRRIQEWLEQLLQLAEAEFQAGNLEGAIDLVGNVPPLIPGYQTTRQRIEKWQAVWKQAQSIYDEAQSALDNENWYGVLSRARELWSSENRYWATVKYQELVAEMQTAREEGQRRQVLSDRSRLHNTQDWLKQWEQQQEQENVAYLQRAQELAKPGTVEGLSAAIDMAYQVLYGSPHYDQAQSLISNWQQQIEIVEDRPYLERAMALATQGDEPSLEAAIEEAQRIYWGRALYEDARDRIDQWNAQLQSLHTQSQIQQLEEVDASQESVAGGEQSPLSPDPALPMGAEANPPIFPW